MIDSSDSVEPQQPWWITFGQFTLNHAQAFLKEFLDELIGENGDFGDESPISDATSLQTTQCTHQPDPLSDDRSLVVPPYIPLGTYPRDSNCDSETVPLTVPPRVTPITPINRSQNPLSFTVHSRQQYKQRRLSLPPELRHWGNWKLIFTAYDHRRVQKYLWSFRSNPIHPFYGYVGNEAALDTALRIIQWAYSQFEDVAGKIVCTRCCPIQLAVVSCDRKERSDFARRFARLLGTPFVEIKGAFLPSIDQLAAHCSAVWRTDIHVREREIEVWPMVRQASGRIKVFIPPMSVFLDNISTVSARWNLDTRSLWDQILCAFVGDAIPNTGLFEFDFSRVCLMIGCGSLKSVPTKHRLPFQPLVVGSS